MLGDDEDKYAPLAIVYDSLVESTDSLNKFLDIFSLTSYPKELVYLVPFEKDSETFITDVFDTYPAVFCINSTYLDFSSYLKEVKNVPAFEFTSQQYFDRKGNFVFHGLNLSIEAIHDLANKQPCWVFIKKFVSMTKRLEVTEEILLKASSTRASGPEVFEPVVIEQAVVKPEVIEEIVEQVIEEISQEAVVPLQLNSLPIGPKIDPMVNMYGPYTHLVAQLQFQIDAYKRLYEFEKGTV